MTLAPIVLFVYNRPWHTRQALEALRNNPLSESSVLYVIADGAKDSASPEDKEKIAEVKAIITEESWCGEVKLTSREKNYGLANNIIKGVTDLIETYGRVIVLEDDIVVSKGYLKYMNDALALYENEDQVGCIHGWNYPLKRLGIKEETFFLPGGDCWGWATWKRAWDFFEPDGVKLLASIEERKLEYAFNRRNTIDFVEMLKNQIRGVNDSWAVRWHASLFLQEMYCLHPVHAMVENIGLDSTGIHCGTISIDQEVNDEINLNKILIKESDWFYEAYKDYIKPKEKNVSTWMNLWERLKRL